MKSDKEELESIERFFSRLEEDKLLSVYLYGSSLEKLSENSDIDLFIILKNSTNPIENINSVIKTIKKMPTKRKIDWDIVFENELNLFYFKKNNIIQYYTVANQGSCVYGKDFLKDLKFDLAKYYECILGTTQRVRHELLNKKSVRFWARKLRRDVLYGILALNYLNGKKRISFKDLKMIEKTYPQLKGCQILLNKKQQLRTLWYYLESLRVILENKMVVDSGDKMCYL